MRIAKVVGQVAESVLSIAGIRLGTEEPHYINTPLTDHVAMRKYGPRIAAETTVAADEDRARSIGFRRLANYIFGANHREEKIAMTAPVAQQSDRSGDEIAMTAPVGKWCEQTIAEIEEWPDTRDINLTPKGRERLERILAQPEP